MQLIILTSTQIYLKEGVLIRNDGDKLYRGELTVSRYVQTCSLEINLGFSHLDEYSHVLVIVPHHWSQECTL